MHNKGICKVDKDSEFLNTHSSKAFKRIIQVTSVRFWVGNNFSTYLEMFINPHN